MADHPNPHSHKRDGTDKAAHGTNSFSPVHSKELVHHPNSTHRAASQHLPRTTTYSVQPGLLPSSRTPPNRTPQSQLQYLRRNNSLTTCTHPGQLSKKLYDALNEQLDEVMSAREEDAKRFLDQLDEADANVRKVQSDMQKLREASEKANAAFLVLQGCLRDLDDKELDQSSKEQHEMLKTQAIVPQSLDADESENRPQREIQPARIGSLRPELEDDASTVTTSTPSTIPATEHRQAPPISPIIKSQDRAQPASELRYFTRTLSKDRAPVSPPRPVTSSNSKAVHEEQLGPLTAEVREMEKRLIKYAGRSRNKGDQMLAQDSKANQESRKHGDRPGIATKQPVVAPSGLQTMTEAISSDSDLSDADELTASISIKGQKAANLKVRDARHAELAAAYDAINGRKSAASKSQKAKPAELGKRKREEL